MSWSVAFIGKPKDIVAALEANSAKLDGQCKVEFDDALPHLCGLLNQNFNVNQNQLQNYRLEASGSGYAVGGEQIHRSCSVKIESIYGTIVAEPANAAE